MVARSVQRWNRIEDPSPCATRIETGPDNASTDVGFAIRHGAALLKSYVTTCRRKDEDPTKMTECARNLLAAADNLLQIRPACFPTDLATATDSVHQLENQIGAAANIVKATMWNEDLRKRFREGIPFYIEAKA